MKNIFRDRRFYSPAVAAASAVLFVSLSVGAATTISTNIVTEGSLTVSGGVYASSTAALTGVISYASSTLQAVSTTDLRVNGVLSASSTALLTSGHTAYASTTLQAVSVGGGGAISAMTKGYCNIVDANITASSTMTFACTGASRVASGDLVFVSATSSLPNNIFVQSANSTTTAGTVEVNLYYNGATGETGAPGSISLNYWAVR